MARPAHPLSQQKLAYHRSQAQARFRGEPWEFTFEAWWAMWRSQWHQRGQAADDLCMIRRDDREAWHPDNCEIVARREYLSPRGRYYKLAHAENPMLGRPRLR